MLQQRDLVPLETGNEKYGEVVVRVLIDLRPLVLVPDVFDRQGMEFERALEELVIGLVGRLDVEPEAELVLLVEALGDVFHPGGRRLALDGEQGPHGFLAPLAAAATPSATYVTAATRPVRRWALGLPSSRLATADVAST